MMGGQLGGVHVHGLPWCRLVRWVCVVMGLGPMLIQYRAVLVSQLGRGAGGPVAVKIFLYFLYDLYGRQEWITLCCPMYRNWGLVAAVAR